MSIRNARNELEEHVGLVSKVKCARVVLGDESYSWENVKVFVLKVGHTVGEAKEFLNSLEFDYHAGFGGQELFGIIWYHDGTYSQRGEYDGSEWWEHCKCPELPEDVK